VINLWNFIQFQTGWFAVVLGAAFGHPWLGALAVMALLGINLLVDSRPLQEATFLLLVGLLGWLWESLLHGVGLVEYQPGAGPFPFQWMAPLWMAALWMNFASTLNFSLAWLHGRPLLAALCGAVGGPLAFFAGEKLGAITLSGGLVTLGVLAVAWLLVTPLLMRVAPLWREGQLAMAPLKAEIPGDE
jgi:hypothetical protein